MFDPMKKLHASRPIALGLFLAIAAVVAIGRFARVGMQRHKVPATQQASPHPPESSTTDHAPPRIAGNLVRQRDQAHQRVLDPSLDGWTSEVVAESVHSKIEHLVSLLTTLPTATRSIPEGILSSRFMCTELRPPLRKLYDAGEFRTFVTSKESASEPVDETGVQRWREVAEPFRDGIAGSVVRSHVKTVGISLAESTAETTHRIELLAQSSALLTEHHFRWRCDWDMDTTGSMMLRSLEVSDYQETAWARPSTLFRDDTQSVVGSTPAYEEQLRHGLNYWLARIPTTRGMYLFAEYGIALGDVNGDQLDDIYVCQPGGLPNRLLVQNSDGTVVDRSRAAGVDWLDHSSSALLVDLDNDDDQDLLIAIEDRRILVLSNDGSGVFDLAVELPIEDRHVQGLSAVDFDNDGDLDVYLTVGFADSRARQGEEVPQFVYHDANEGGANVLFRNDITANAWHFTDVTKLVGLNENNRRHSLAAAWEDFDNDGDQDLYVANDYGQNCLYRNDGDRFQEIARTAGVVDYGSGMSVSWSDFDLDGNIDLYVGNMFSAAGNRIASQAAFRPSQDEGTRQILRRFAKGNTLFRNLGRGQFRDVGRSLSVEMGRWSWSSLFSDLNNDGLEDLFVVNGYVSNEDIDDL